MILGLYKGKLEIAIFEFCPKVLSGMGQWRVSGSISRTGRVCEYMCVHDVISIILESVLGSV